MVTYDRNPADVAAGIDASKTSYDSSGREVINKTTSGGGSSSSQDVVYTKYGGVSTLTPDLVKDQVKPSTTVKYSGGSSGSSFDSSKPFGSQLPDNVQRQPTSSGIVRYKSDVPKDKFKVIPSFSDLRTFVSEYRPSKVVKRTKTAIKETSQEVKEKGFFGVLGTDIKAGAVPYLSTANLPVRAAGSIAVGTRTLAKEGVKVTAKRYLPQSVQKVALFSSKEFSKVVSRKVLEKTGSSALSKLGGLGTRGGISIGTGFATLETGKFITRATSQKEQKELAKKIGKEDVISIIQSGNAFEFGSDNLGTSYDNALKEYYKEQGVTDEKELNRLTKQAKSDPRGFYSGLGFEGTELDSKVTQSSKYVNSPYYKKLLTEWVPGGRLIVDSKKRESDFSEGVTKRAKELGLSEFETEQILGYSKRQRTGGELSALGSAFTFNVGSEAIGQFTNKIALKGFKSISSKAGLKLAGRSFLGTLLPGFVEGAGIEATTQKGRYEVFNTKDILIGGGFGAVSAGTIQAGIVGTKINYPRVSRAIEIGAYTTDILEKPADITEGIIRKSVSRYSKTPSLSLGIIDTRPGNKKGEVGIIKVTEQEELINNINKDLDKSLSKKTTTKTNPSKNQNLRTKVKTPTNIFNNPIKTPTDVLTETNIFNNPIKTPTDILTETPTQTNLPVSSFINVPTTVAKATLPPIVPLSFPIGSGRGGYGRNKGVKYVNELAVGRKALSGLVSKNIFPSFTPKTRKRSKKTSKRKKRSRDPFDFAFPSFPF